MRAAAAVAAAPCLFCCPLLPRAAAAACVTSHWRRPLIWLPTCWQKSSAEALFPSPPFTLPTLPDSRSCDATQARQTVCDLLKLKYRPNPFPPSSPFPTCSCDSTQAQQTVCDLAKLKYNRLVMVHDATDKGLAASDVATLAASLPLCKGR